MIKNRQKEEKKSSSGGHTHTRGRGRGYYTNSNRGIGRGGVYSGGYYPTHAVASTSSQVYPAVQQVSSAPGPARAPVTNPFYNTCYHCKQDGHKRYACPNLHLPPAP